MTVYKAKNGKFYCRFKIHGEQKHLLCQGATTKAEALAIEDAEKYKLRQQQLGLVNSGRKIYSAGFLFNNLLKYSRNKGKKSYSKDEYQVKELLKYFKEKNLADDISLIKQKNILELQLYLKNAPTKQHSQRANSTVNKYIACLKTAFNLLVKDEDVEIYVNPCIGVSNLTEDNRRTTYLPQDKKDEFLSFLPEIVRDIVELDLSTGLRIGNVMHAHKSEFDLADKYWTILRENNKGKKYIRIRLNKKALEIVQKYYYSTDDYLFINPDTGRPFNSIKKSFKTAAKKIGIPDLQPRDLRRTVGTKLYKEGKSLRVIRDVLHHSDVSTTERYLGITPQELDEAYLSLDD